MGDTLQRIKDGVITRQRNEIQRLVATAIDEGIDPKSIIDDGLIAAMDVVGQQFSDSDIFVPKMLVSALTIKLGLERVKPLLKSEETEPKGMIIIGTVKGDIHDIGKNIVLMMLEGAGFEVVDLGVDLTVEKLVERIEAIGPDLLGLSALLTTTMPQMKKVIGALTEAGLRENLKIIIGGAPVNQKFSDDIEADGYAQDAGEAISLVKRLVKS